MNGKGDRRRASSVSIANFNESWERLFNRGQTEVKEDYNQFVQECWLGMEDLPNLAIATLGLTGEAGEVAEKVKKHLRGDAAHNPKELPDIRARNMEVAKELGDVLFYLTWIANYHGFTLEQVMAANILKLTDRRRRTGTLRGDGDNR